MPGGIRAVILARSSSPERPRGLLSDRALTPVAGQTVLAHIVRRLKLCRRLDGLILAVGDPEADSHILETAAALGLDRAAGHPHDLLSRLWLAGRQSGAEHVVRVNGNFPLIDPWALDELIESHLSLKADYSANNHYQGLVYGLGAEIMAAPVLRELAEYGPPADLYSGTRLFLRRRGEFKVNLQAAAGNSSEFSAAVDFAGDEKVIEAILAAHSEPGNAEVLEFFQTRPDLKGRRAGPAEVGLSKVLLFPEKLAALKDNGSGGRDLSYPVSVELSLTNLCNQNCLWCSDRDLRQRSPDRLNPALLRQLFSDLGQGGTRGVTIEGGGEPSLWPFFEEAVEAALENGLAVGLITNGLDLFPPGRNPDIYRRFEWIRVSLDAAGPGQYQRAKGIEGFDRVLDNLRRLAAAPGRTTLGVGYVLSNHNDEPDQLQHLVLSLRSLGLDYIQIRPVVDHPELLSRQRLDFLKKFESPDFSVNLAALSDNEPTGNAGLPCLAHSLSTVIGADGAVWLCGRLNTEAHSRPLGNLNDHSFQKIWMGPERAAQAAQAASPAFCQANCPQCRMTKYNRLLADLTHLKTKNFI